MDTITITKGDTLYPWLSKITRNGAPIDLTNLTVKMRMVRKDDQSTVKINSSSTGITKQPTQVFTANPTTDLLTCNDHGLKGVHPDGTHDQIVLTTSGTLPAGLELATRYFPVQITPNSFGVSLVPGGAPIDITGTGTGTHTFAVVGSVQYDWQSADVDTADEYFAWLILESGGESQRVPHDGNKLLVQVVEGP